ncbi:MAG: DNA alkylation repair protein [Anaerolineae bacterium]|nr:DNA alkylation repair protein [Anaerolineae bacterium]
MPAIDLARLKKQTARLADLFDQPAVFIPALQEILDLYVNHSLRTRKSVAPSSVLPTYRTPTEILQRIESELSPLASQNANQALELADELWDTGYLETRLLAAFLLGHISPEEDRLLARLTAWTQKVRDPNVRTSLLTNSLARLRKETPDQFLILVTEWLYPHRQQLWSNGLQALLPLIKAQDFENLPSIFDIIDPIIEAAPTFLQGDIENIIRALYKASPTETTYFIKNILERKKNPKTSLLIRRILPTLPTDLQISLQEGLKAN